MALLVPHRVEQAFGVLVLGVVDPVASLSGQRFGRRAYRALATSKTYARSAAFLATTLVLALLAVAALGEMSGAAPLIAIAIAVAVTFEEAVIGGGADNVVLPVTQRCHAPSVHLIRQIDAAGRRISGELQGSPTRSADAFPEPSHRASPFFPGSP